MKNIEKCEFVEGNVEYSKKLGVKRSTTEKGLPLM